MKSERFETCEEDNFIFSPIFVSIFMGGKGYEELQQA